MNANVFIEQTETPSENQMSFKFRLCFKFVLFCYLNFMVSFQKTYRTCTFKFEYVKKKSMQCIFFHFYQDPFLINGTPRQNIKTRKYTNILACKLHKL